MKKRSLAMMIASMALVGAVGVGATLAYLSDSTGSLTNTFTVGNGINITLTEQDVADATKRVEADTTDAAQSYGEFLPGDSQTKDPMVTVKKDSSNCYVFMYVTGVDELQAKNFTVGGWSDSWKLVEAQDNGVDGLYVYVDNQGAAKVVEKNVADQDLAALFDTVTYNASADGTDVLTDAEKIVVKAAAVQADIQNVTSAYETALGEAKGAFGLTTQQ